VSRRKASIVVVVAAALPRLVALLYDRAHILTRFTEKSDTFAQTFVKSGTFGYVPHVPSAYTQPLYGFFLVPIYWIFGRSWESVGLFQIAVAAATALVVYEIGRRFLSPGAGLFAALAATLNPYLIWHDVHVNREIVDQLAAAALVLLTLLAAERRSVWLAAAAGAVTGVAILGNTRLALLPLVLIGYLAWRLGLGRSAAVAAVALLASTAVVVLPWVVRNKVQVGCFALTTDARALWKANDADTYRVLTSGHWIDDVPDPKGAPLSPEQAAGYWFAYHRVIRVNECAQVTLYQAKVRSFWEHHPGEKAKLSGLAVRMLWDPQATETVGSPGRGTWLDTARSWAEPAYMIVLYVLGIVGVFRAPRPFVVLMLALLVYQTLAAVVFVGATRYRVPWDFTIALLAGAAVMSLAPRAAALRARASAPT
jgi:4-amino-4-deoxy-L-arabinose transferase-like glycosyltransferase